MWMVGEETLSALADYCAEFLVHGVDVEGKRAGVEEPLVENIGQMVTRAGNLCRRGARAIGFAPRQCAGPGRVDLTIGSALDIFGGDVAYRDVVAWMRRLIRRRKRE